ncbi:alpha/beta hydrolase [Amycolatopsis sp. NEAU-NG30]|uniref:Alpha/beta hydrolase n=1 Tax=Amycolatopsis melonis TaxID=3156488 RepID=A0ABV0LRC0_9PSEU
MRGKIAALVILLVTALAQPVAAAPRLDWVPCGPAADCAKITVPLDWDVPDGPRITLAFNRHKADPAHRKGALFMAPGVGFDFLLTDVRSGVFAMFPDLLRDFDLIGVDVRGGGIHPFNGRQPAPFRSDAIECGLPVHDPGISSSAAEVDALVRYNRAYEASCTSPLADHMDAVTQAKDLDAVRAALGEEKVSFFFYGYTGPGQAYARLFPHRVRAMAMDSPLDHSVPVVVRAAEYASTVEREFNRFVAWCNGSASCVLHGQDVAAVYDSLLRHADRYPVRLDLPPEPGRPEPQQATVLVRGDDLAFLTEQLLEIGDLTLPGGGMGWADLATAIQQAGSGASPTFAFVYRYSWGYRDLWNPLRAGQCDDYPASVVDLAAARPIVTALAPHTRGASQAWDALSGCVGRRPGTNPPGPTVVRGVPPVLVVGARGNPWSPYPDVARVSAEIGGSVLLTYAGDAHIAFLSSPCVAAHIQSYLDELTLPAAGTVCPAVPVRTPGP